MRLFIVRHAIAVPHGTKGIEETLRPLTPRGIERFESAAAGLARAFPRPDALLTSPWKRARQTAEILAAAWGRLELKDTPALTGGNVDALARVLRAYPKDASVALVGHEPWLSELLARLLGSSEDERFQFKKGGVAVVDLPGELEEGGKLVAYLPPKLMRRLR
jgi:phosphohistidine phosphatase